MHTDGYSTKQVIQPLYCSFLEIHIYICIHTLLYLYGKSVKNITIEIKLYITNTTLLYCYTCPGIHMYEYV